MSDTKGSKKSHDSAPRQAEASAAAGPRAQQSVQGRASAATQYWQRLAAAGRVARSPTAQTDAMTHKRQQEAPAQRV